MSDSSDRELLDLIRRRGPLTVVEMADVLGVTATAIRNRLTRLLATGLVERRAEHAGRGRPRHRYQASVEAHKRLGQNYADLAVVLWEEMMRTVEDRKLRRVLFARITDRLAELYRTRVTGEGWEGPAGPVRLRPARPGGRGRGRRGTTPACPVLRQHSCPYYELAEVDRAICALERKMFEKVLGRGLRLSQCRLDGDRSCDFEAKSPPLASPAPARPGWPVPAASTNPTPRRGSQ